MSLLALSRVTFEYSCGSPVFHDVSLCINPGDRIALVGPNGAGKTTLLRLFAGDLDASGGSLTRRRGLRVAVCKQDSQIENQSGGEHSREELSRVFASDAELLILDEPTNHLDLGAREWLERKLARLPAAVIVASHDRAFLTAFADRIVEIERGKVSMYNTGYVDYREMKQGRVAQQWADYEGYERRKSALEFAARKREQLSARVAHAPAGARSSHDFYIRKAGKVARTGRLLRERVMDLGEEAEKPWEEQAISKLSFVHVRTSSEHVLSVEGVGVGRLFAGMSFHLRRGDRLAITGPNGSGKTTLLDIISGRRTPDAGTIRLGHNVEAATIQQVLDEQLKYNESPLEICGTDTMARTLLACLKVPPTCLNRPLGLMSGGERIKVAIARVLNSPANLLLLDEPTNHLEIEAQEALEEALASYPGTVIAVSHDRAFLSSLGTGAQILRLGSKSEEHRHM